MNASARSINKFLVEDDSLALIFLAGFFSPQELQSVVGEWFDSEPLSGLSLDDRINCVLDLRAADLDQGVADQQWQTVVSNLDERVRHSRVEKLALVTGLANYQFFSRMMGAESGKLAPLDNFYSLDNACHWLLGTGREALHELDPAFGDFRYEMRPISDAGVVVRHISGRVTAENMLGAMRRLLQAPFYSPGCRVLTDCRDARFADVGMASEDAATDVFQRFAESTPGRSAYVFSPADYAKAGRYKEFFDKRGLQVMPFKNLEEACAFINHDERAILATLEAMRVEQFFASPPLPNLDDYSSRIVEITGADQAAPTSDTLRDRYLALPEHNLLVRRLSGPGSASEIVRHTKRMEELFPGGGGRKVLLDIRDLALSQTDRLFFSQGAEGRLSAATGDTIAVLCGRELLHVAEGFAGTQDNMASRPRAVTTAFSASTWLTEDLQLLNHCLRHLESA